MIFVTDEFKRILFVEHCGQQFVSFCNSQIVVNCFVSSFIRMEKEQLPSIVSFAINRNQRCKRLNPISNAKLSATALSDRKVTFFST